MPVGYDVVIRHGQGRDPFDERLEAAERACRAWGRWLHALGEREPDRSQLFERAELALRDWWAVKEGTE